MTTMRTTQELIAVLNKHGYDYPVIENLEINFPHSSPLLEHMKDSFVDVICELSNDYPFPANSKQGMLFVEALESLGQLRRLEKNPSDGAGKEGERLG